MRYGEIWLSNASRHRFLESVVCHDPTELGVRGLSGYQVKNMGGIGAHCAEDYETLKMFVEAPSTYKDEQKTC